MKIATAATVVLFSLGVLASLPAFAQPAGGGGSGGQGPQKSGQGQDQASFETRKAEILKNHQARIQAMQQALTCIQSAKDQEALRTCRENERKAMEQMRDQMRGERRGGDSGGGPGQGRGPGGPQRQ